MIPMIHPASFKDPAGFVFQKEGTWYRQVNKSGLPDMETLFQSGLYDSLVAARKLIPHQRIAENLTASNEWYATFLPEQLHRISYPYEWSFSQLKDAALLTLDLALLAIEKGMILKDATPFNVQFHEGRPVFIDLLSFTRYDASKPWVAYRQFCENFLFPLLLEKYLGWNARELLRTHLDGIPLALTAKLLPWSSRLNPSVAMHVFLQQKMANGKTMSAEKATGFSKQKMTNLLLHLQSMIRGLTWKRKTTWSDYYTDTILDQTYLQEKEKAFLAMLSRIKGKTALDLGANDGYFSRLAANKGWQVVATDFDEACIDRLYGQIRTEKIQSILPLCIDMANPSPALGFAHRERDDFTRRMKSDLVLALALVHHLVIGKNIPLSRLADYFAELGPNLLIEFVPREDEKTKGLLAQKEDIYLNYTPANFEQAFGERYDLTAKQAISGTHRVLYLYQRKEK